MKHSLLLVLLFISACSEEIKPKINVEDYAVDKKYCVHMCMRATFSMFHGEGHSWGAGSSSMNGLSQEKIFDRVKSECVGFYDTERCCRRDQNDYEYKTVKSWIHGSEYGPCAGDVK